MRLPDRHVLPLAAGAALALASGWSAGVRAQSPVPGPGPAPERTVQRYDVVGTAATSDAGGAAITGASPALPPQSYVEVTALASGRTILVLVDRRGAPGGDAVIALSPGAAAQLGIAGQDKAPVRVREVSPSQQERGLLQMGKSAPPRLDTPKSLLTVLSRRLAEHPGPLFDRPSAETGAEPATAAVHEAPPPSASPAPARPASPPPAASPAAAPPTRAAAALPTPTGKDEGSLVVQVGAFSARERASAAAARVGGAVSRAGAVWRVRIGPFSSTQQADAALAKARAAGFADARIMRAQ